LNDGESYVEPTEETLHAATLLARQLGLRAHDTLLPVAVDGELEQRRLCMPLGVDAKAALGSDGLTYFFDLSLSLPRDTSSSEPAAAQRLDLLTTWRARVAYLEREAKRDAEAAAAAAAAAAKNGDADDDDNDDNDKVAADKAKTTGDDKEDSAAKKAEKATEEAADDDAMAVDEPKKSDESKTVDDKPTADDDAKSSSVATTSTTKTKDKQDKEDKEDKDVKDGEEEQEEEEQQQQQLPLTDRELDDREATDRIRALETWWPQFAVGN
jgi:hypothetical protein